jgi:hypothetical protein
MPERRTIPRPEAIFEGDPGRLLFLPAESPRMAGCRTSQSKPMTEASPTLPPLPDHLSVDPASPHYAAAVVEHDIGIRFNGKERSDVEEYCISEGWVKVPAGRTLDRKGKPLMIKLKGKVEAFYK